MRFFISFSPLPCWGGRSREHLGGLWQPAQVNIFVWIYLHIIPIWVWEKSAALWSASIEHQVLRHCQDGWRWEYLKGAIRGVWEWCKQNLFCLLPFFAILLPFRSTKLSRIAPVLRLHEDYHSDHSLLWFCPKLHWFRKCCVISWTAVRARQGLPGWAASFPKDCYQIFTPGHYLVNTEWTGVATYS